MQAEGNILEKSVDAPAMPAGRPAKSPRSEFGQRLTHARQQAGLTQVQLAERLGTSQRVIAHWERTRVALRAEQLAELVSILRVSVDHLVGKENGRKRGTGPVGRARRAFEALSHLPRHHQQRIIDVVEALVAQHGTATR